ncbi:MAG: DUF3800 domain-containing protein [Actinomycetaceae bacterium]|nr:DUF3800 domain-containing protein [Actinomycetaceae bacterium]
MLIAYLDEVGEPGAFVGPDHRRFNTSPAFGYAGFIIDDGAASEFGRFFNHKKRELFKHEIAEAQKKSSDADSTWERKGSEYFSKDILRYPERLRIFKSLIRFLIEKDGRLFFYVDEKERGTPKQTRIEHHERESRSMQEALNRLARYANDMKSNIFVVMDQINENERRNRIHKMYGHIYGRSSSHAEMKRIIEPPMHLDSKLSSNIQFADWVAALVNRATHQQLLKDPRFAWVVQLATIDKLFPPKQRKRLFTYESKLHLHGRSIEDVNNFDLFRSEVIPPHYGQYASSEKWNEMLQNVAKSSRTGSGSTR